MRKSSPTLSGPWRGHDFNAQEMGDGLKEELISLLHAESQLFAGCVPTPAARCYY